MSRINLWLGQHKKSIQVALFQKKTKKNNEIREKNASVVVKTRV